jgi:dTDP-4-dehydrorhamnose 3,5-epimerase
MPIKVTPTAIPDVLIIEPKVFGDERGCFFESFNENDFSRAIGGQVSFVQDNHSVSNKGVLRGLHYQVTQTQAKLVRVCCGAVFDVAVDLRQSSKTYGKWVGVELSAKNNRQLWIPSGFAHGFLSLEDETVFLYKTTDYWNAIGERCINSFDESLNIQWPHLKLINITRSAKDANGLSFESADKF